MTLEDERERALMDRSGLMDMSGRNATQRAADLQVAIDRNEVRLRSLFASDSRGAVEAST